MAGLFNYWRSKNAPEPPIATFTVVTTEPNKWMARIHNRMPVILQDNQINRWQPLLQVSLSSLQQERFSKTVVMNLSGHPRLASSNPFSFTAHYPVHYPVHFP